MKLGLFGGSFDPIHLGHVLPVRAAQQRLGLDSVIYLPTAQPPHKPGRRFAPTWARYAMVELALLPYRELVVSTFELSGDRSAYTIDTLEHFRAEQPGAELFLLIGADSSLELDQWRRWRDVVRLATLVVLARPGFTREGAGLAPELLRLELIEWFADRAVEVSSTRVRAALHAGEPVAEDSVPALVLDFIRKYVLYR